MLCWRCRGSGWAQVQNWNETLSGGARALHNPNACNIVLCVSNHCSCFKYSPHPLLPIGSVWFALPNL